ncbi:MAG: MBL fold metallo-hydrolase [Pseudomonadales bacterium]|jgi:glyoxylase-like metal-dependent hydrolase (beta-lactamase superfamily II)|nr:MBL fold metallo-hydrolase [Pseudomonadales bacterium]
MKAPVYHPLSENLYCIDALYTGVGLACCYLLRDGDECALIETGTANSVGNILATLEVLNIAPSQMRYIIPTHVHLDHAGGAGQLMRQFPDAELLVHPKGARHMIDPARLVASAQRVYGEALFLQLHGQILPVAASRVRTLEDDETVTIGSRRLRVKHTRGHADHHFCLYDEHTRGWFSGDMFGASYARNRYSGGSFVIPATTPTQFDPAIYQTSVRALCSVDPQQFYLTHFSALAYEPQQQERLLRQLDEYATLGQQFDGDMAALEAQVLDITRRELLHLVSSAEAEAEIATLHADSKLNAQGIAWWSQSQRSH